MNQSFVVHGLMQVADNNARLLKNRYYEVPNIEVVTGSQLRGLDKRC